MNWAYTPFDLKTKNQSMRSSEFLRMKTQDFALIEAIMEENNEKCTHIVWVNWGQIFWYFWGIADEKLDKEVPGDSIFSHNTTTIYKFI